MRFYDKHRASGTIKYTFGYLANSISLKVPILKKVRRTGSHNCDWTGGNIWGSPVIALAPPRINDPKLALNIDTYINYVDK